MPVVLEGFDKGDRSEISLPKSQVELMKAVHKLGKPMILVLMNGSALAINWAADNVPAILEAWYPGEFGGNAIADVLFGDYNPAGRLPITFYKSVNDLPDFKSYEMENRTYKYFKGEPLFPFGHGLSYTNFTYSNLEIEDAIEAGNDIVLKVDVTNSGSLNGDEVVQLYLTQDDKKENAPIRSLIGFERIHLTSGETKTINFTVTKNQYAFIDLDGSKVVEKGNLKISIGGKQPDFKNTIKASSTQVLTKTILIK